MIRPGMLASPDARTQQSTVAGPWGCGSGQHDNAIRVRMAEAPARALIVSITPISIGETPPSCPLCIEQLRPIVELGDGDVTDGVTG